MPPARNQPISWNEIRDRAIQFSREWAEAKDEDADAKSFLDAFFNVFGVPRKRVGSFERHVKKIDGKSSMVRKHLVAAHC